LVLKMKMSSNICRLAFDPSGRRHGLFVLVVCATVMLAMGCSQKKTGAEIPAAPPPPTTQTDASPAAAATPSTAESSEPAAANATNGLPDLRPLNQALIGWIISNQRHPATFEESAAATGKEIRPQRQGTDQYRQPLTHQPNEEDCQPKCEPSLHRTQVKAGVIKMGLYLD
jgi:hypothetical protein